MGTNKLSTDTNNINQIIHSYSTAIDYYTDRTTSAHSARARIKEKLNLGVGVTAQSLFTNLTS